MKIKKLNEYEKSKILIFSGSARSKNNCPDQNSKTIQIVESAIKDLPKDIEIQLIDLSIQDDKPIIQPCKGCISTSGGAHCHWYCSCYSKGDDEPDKIYEEDIYLKLEKCDAFLLFSPINWWNVPTEVKALFDRLTCASLTLTQDQAKELLGDDIKNAVETKKLSETKKFKSLIKNQLEGKIGGFYIHGDNGADDYKDRDLPKAYKDHNIGNFNDPKYPILPIVWQCRYMGIDVPENLIETFYMNENISYSEANDKLKEGKMEFAIKKAKNLILNTHKYIQS